MRRELGLNGAFVVTYAGALGMANDIPTVLRAADRLRDNGRIQFLFVGDGKERRNLEKMAREMKLANVVFAGSRPKADMPMILAASDACLAILMDIPMFRTTYPNKVFDYMAAAKPTILAIDGVIRQVVEAAEGGVFVPPGDDAALADAVLSLATNPEETSKMGLAARDYVVRHFNRAEQAKEFLDLVTGLADAKS
ncbi:MAG: glycosyltransferase family 4 protein [Deltaproteobacteria bacterium]|nr:glycosyltransferase family 4 protein [Deltaproteobacteria bacterium]